MATMVENAQEMIRLAVRVSRRRNIGLVVQMAVPEKRSEDDPADVKFTMVVTGESDFTFTFTNPNQAVAFLADIDAPDLEDGMRKALRRQRRQDLRKVQQLRDAELADLDAEFSIED